MTQAAQSRPTATTAADTADAPVPLRPRGAPWNGRPRVADPKACFVGVRCTADEHAALTAAAAQAGLSVGAYLRATALGSPSPRAVRRPPVEKVMLARWLGELGKVGSNVNQLARIANTSGDMPEPDTLADIAADVRAMRDALMKALGRGD
jgi:hypothetical protein